MTAVCPHPSQAGPQRCTQLFRTLFSHNAVAAHLALTLSSALTTTSSPSQKPSLNTSSAGGAGVDVEVFKFQERWWVGCRAGEQRGMSARQEAGRFERARNPWPAATSPVSGETRFCRARICMPALILRAASAETLLLLLPMFQSLRALAWGAATVVETVRGAQRRDGRRSWDMCAAGRHQSTILLIAPMAAALGKAVLAGPPEQELAGQVALLNDIIVSHCQQALLACR